MFFPPVFSYLLICYAITILSPSCSMRRRAFLRVVAMILLFFAFFALSARAPERRLLLPACLPPLRAQSSVVRGSSGVEAGVCRR